MRTRRRHARDHRLEMRQPGNHWCEELVDRRGRRLEASPGRDWRTSKWTKTAKRSDAAISGPSALDDEGDMEVILHAIRGLGGKVLKTNVDVERAKLIRATLAGMSGSSGRHAKAS